MTSKVPLPSYEGLSPMQVLDRVADEFADAVIVGKVAEYVEMVKARREAREQARKQEGG